MAKVRVCKEAGDDIRHQKRAAPFPGPRCYSCHHARRHTVKARARVLHVERTYGLSEQDVEAVRETMPLNGRGMRVCPGCKRATGLTKALAVDHDHEKERQGLPIRETVRGFLCSTCNQMIGKYDISALLRLVDYLRNPPAFSALHTNGH